ncbi:hypothetical protein [Roseovarius indicus]|uniref:hypothetical protein n=1 Tax=Roseovarius indicus TaxID=540747 RepID=UPI0011608C61|nr:hypothetical protein [Roseovarius indicus]
MTFEKNAQLAHGLSLFDAVAHDDCELGLVVPPFHHMIAGVVKIAIGNSTHQMRENFPHPDGSGLVVCADENMVLHKSIHVYDNVCRQAFNTLRNNLASTGQGGAVYL